MFPKLQLSSLRHQFIVILASVAMLPVMEFTGATTSPVPPYGMHVMVLPVAGLAVATVAFGWSAFVGLGLGLGIWFGLGIWLLEPATSPWVLIVPGLLLLLAGSIAWYERRDGQHLKAVIAATLLHSLFFVVTDAALYITGVADLKEDFLAESREDIRRNMLPPVAPEGAPPELFELTLDEQRAARERGRMLLFLSENLYPGFLGFYFLAQSGLVVLIINGVVLRKEEDDNGDTDAGHLAEHAFGEFRLPDWWLIIGLAGIATALVEVGIAQTVGLNIVAVFFLGLYLQGLAIAHNILNRLDVIVPVRIFIYVMFSVTIVSFFIFTMGSLLDFWFDFRNPEHYVENEEDADDGPPDEDDML